MNFISSCGENNILFTHSLRSFLKYLVSQLESKIIHTFAPPRNILYDIQLRGCYLPVRFQKHNSQSHTGAMDLYPFRRNFEESRNRQKYCHSLKEHLVKLQSLVVKCCIL